jgi:Tfp pilus assembly protein PilV
MSITTLNLKARGIVRGPAACSRGFSALEVLIAAAVTIVGILAVASMFPSSYSNVSKSGTQTTAVHLAQQRIEALRNQGYANILPGTGAGQDDETNQPIAGYTGYTRSTTIAQNTPVANITQITVTVTPPVGSAVTVRSLVAQ